MRQVISAALAVTLALAATISSAQSKDASKPYLDAVQKGDKTFVGGDTPGAINAYQEAIKIDASQMLAFYRLGEAQRRAGKLDEADQAWQTALGKKGTPELNAKVLFCIADLRERQGKWDPAREAWANYEKFLDAHAKVRGFRNSATERKKQIDRRVKDEKDYGAVKERIAKREEEQKREAEENAKKDKLNK
jgi:tetratricopeptide (TPR) repeat protein